MINGCANGYSLPIVGQKTAKNQLNLLPYFGKVVLYSRSFSSFFVRRDKILLFNYQLVTSLFENKC